MWYNKKQCYVNKKGAAMKQYIGQQFAALRYEKNILVVEEIQSGGNLDGNPLPTARLVHHR